MTNPNDTYTSPLATRNASPEMLRLWSPRHKFNTWRRIWLAVAEAQYEVTKDWGADAGAAPEGARSVSDGPGASPQGHPSPDRPGADASGSSRPRSGPLVTREQVEVLRAVVERGITDEEIARAAELEGELRHDVMSHVHCLGESCPEARAIIHLGCTSQDVVCNADLAVIQLSVRAIQIKLARTILAIATCAKSWHDLPALGFTHYQSAQPTTVGRRIAGWAYELRLALERFEFTTIYENHYRGFRGATGTQASFLQLFGSSDLVESFEQEAIAAFEYHCINVGVYPPSDFSQGTFALTGQTYPRSYDTFILADLASVAAVLHKIATDIRLLSNRKEIDEPFGSKQIGSSAMPYKRNPMRCERICGLTRFVMNLVGNAYDTAATQWLERTLDDSSNRRLSLPEAFLALDGALDLMHNVASGLVVHEAMVKKNLMLELPFLATENILMEAVKAGGDRQDLHERIRVHAQEAGHRVKHLGLDNDLIDRLRNDPAFASVRDRLTDGDLLDPMRYVGRSVEQTERFIAEVIGPLRERYADALGETGDSEPRV
jgi:adenylosuccinate lyase